MIDRRRHSRVDVDYWASLKHPLLGTVTGEVQDMSISGVSLKLDEDVNFFVMMELDVRLHGEGWDATMPSLPVQVVRVQDREIALQFLDICEDIWAPEDNIDTGMGTNIDSTGIFANSEQLGELEEIAGNR